jgi:hypothetical protein
MMNSVTFFVPTWKIEYYEYFVFLKFPQNPQTTFFPQPPVIFFLLIILYNK